MDPQVSMDVRIITTQERRGIVAAYPKFVVHVPNSRAGYPFRITIASAQAAIYLIKFMATADWALFCQIFGMPKRWATYRPSATPEEKKQALEMLKNMGSAAYGMFSEAFQLNLVESSQRGQAPYKDLVDWCERKQSIGYLGQHMTTDTSGSTGTMSTAVVHNDVREDLLKDDARRESRTIRRQIIAPMVALEYPGRDVPLPTFRRCFREPIDRQQEANVIKAAQSAGMQVPRAWAYERLGIPEPKPSDEVLEAGLDAFADGFKEEPPVDAE